MQDKNKLQWTIANTRMIANTSRIVNTPRNTITPMIAECRYTYDANTCIELKSDF